ncbi:MAG: hypothetical protein H6569_11840 [Lewinellaceae bacterium]|nr:hypothetical protein [Lewinellaceae bacterium]
MKSTNFSTLFLSLFLGCLAGAWSFGLSACQSDSGNANDSVTATEGGAQQTPTGPQVNPRKVVLGYLDRVKKSQQVYDDFKSNILALQKEVAALPASYKQQAKGFADLEGDLAKYPEKGTVMLDEAALIIKELEAQLESDWAMDENRMEAQNDEAMIGSVLLRRIKDLEINESSYNEAYSRVEKAVEKIKQAKGSPVELSL